MCKFRETDKLLLRYFIHPRASKNKIMIEYPIKLVDVT